MFFMASGLLFNSAAEAQSFLKRLGFKKESILSNKTVTDGLREALKVGIERAVKFVGKNDGFFGNKDIKIPLPKSLRRIERPLRAIGYEKQVDEFVLSMNRAAEAAAPLAQEMFVDAIANMTVDDAKGLLDGSDTAATKYLDKNTRENLAKAFKPQIRKTMDEFGVTKKYLAVTEKYSSLPIARKLSQGSVEEYTANKALDGLFFVLGEEEKRIRTQPAARSTALLRKVFTK
jgi:hypothetical protein